MNIDYGKIVKRSWELTWNNKWLWVMGLVLAVFAGSGYRGTSSNSSGSSSGSVPSASPSPQPVINTIKNQTSYVLGAATDVLKNWFTNVPLQNWILFALLILVFIIFTSAVVWVVTSWAKGALIWGLNDADNGKPVDLKSVSPKGISKIKDLIVFKLISAGFTLAMVLGFGLIFGAGFLVRMAVPVLGIIWLILFGFLGFMAFIIAVYIFAMLSIYAERLIVLKDYSAWDAWKKGFELSKKNILPTLGMGIIDSAIGCGAGCLGIFALLLILGVPAFLLIMPMFSGGSFHFPSVGQIIGLVVLLFVFTSANLLMRAILVVFGYGNWNLFFKEVFVEQKNEQ